MTRRSVNTSPSSVLKEMKYTPGAKFSVWCPRIGQIDEYARSFPSEIHRKIAIRLGERGHIGRCAGRGYIDKCLALVVRSNSPVVDEHTFRSWRITVRVSGHGYSFDKLMIGRAIRESWNDKRNVSLGKAVGLDHIHIGKLRIADRNINPEFDLLGIITVVDCCGTDFQWIAAAEDKIRLRAARERQK